MIKHGGMLLTLLMACLGCAVAQREFDYGGVGGGFYAAGGKIGGGGGYLGLYQTGRLSRILNSGLLLDLGVMGRTRKYVTDGVFSVNYVTTYNLRRDPDTPEARGGKPGFLFLTGGYTRFSNSGDDGLNYGGGFMWRFKEHDSDYKAIRLEYRETYIPGWGRLPGVRLSFEKGGEY